jgi:multidrug efflux system membrane fusion protein
MPQPPTPNVVVEEVIIHDEPEYFYTTGETVAVKSVDIVANVSGILEKMLYQKGDVVLKGTPLFHIRQTPYLIAIKSAQAKLETSKAKLLLTESNLTTTRQLQNQNVKTEQDLQTDISARDQAKATVKECEAELEKAELNLKYTEISSPITGKTNISEIATGNIVGPGTNNNILTTINVIDPIGIIFPITDVEFHYIWTLYLKELEKNKTTFAKSESKSESKPESDSESKPESKPKQFEMGFFKNLISTSENYPFKGIIKTIDNKINRTTGTLNLYGEIPNPKYEILPGEVCRIRILTNILKDAVHIRQEAISIDLNQHYVFIIDENNIVKRKNIELSKTITSDKTRVVIKGLQKGEKYVVRGIQNIKDNDKVIVIDGNNKEQKEEIKNNSENNHTEKNKNNESNAP